MRNSRSCSSSLDVSCSMILLFLFLLVCNTRTSLGFGTHSVVSSTFSSSSSSSLLLSSSSSLSIIRRRRINHHHHHQQDHPRSLFCLPNSLRQQQQSCSLLAATFSSEDGVEDSTVSRAAAATPTVNGDIPTTTPTRVRDIQRSTRLPVWPVWGGVLVWLISKIQQQLSRKNDGDSNNNDVWLARLEDQITGRVCPNFFNYNDADPFIMLVHHTHSFAPWDPIRWFQRQLILPEGFPAHPHRGFITLTYFIDGGFVHRDSMGIKQIYGTRKSAENSNNEKSLQLPKQPASLPHSQWLHTGAGLLHEEMFDFQTATNSNRHELFQLWINLPSDQKYTSPFSVLLGSDEYTAATTPLVQTASSQTLVLAGSYQGGTTAATAKSETPIASPMSIYHVVVEPQGGEWTVELPLEFETVLAYVRQGVLLNTADNTRLPPHSIVYFDTRTSMTTTASSTGRRRLITLKNPHSDQAADFIFLAGQPLREPCVSQGSMVMTSADEINQAYQDYQVGFFGRPWDHKLTDLEWDQHVGKYPSRYTSSKNIK